MIRLSVMLCVLIFFLGCPSGPLIYEREGNGPRGGTALLMNLSGFLIEYKASKQTMPPIESWRTALLKDLNQNGRAESSEELFTEGDSLKGKTAIFAISQPDGSWSTDLLDASAKPILAYIPTHRVPLQAETSMTSTEIIEHSKDCFLADRTILLLHSDGSLTKCSCKEELEATFSH